MRLTPEEEESYRRRITEGNSEKVYFQSTVVLVGLSITIVLAFAVLVWSFFQPTVVQFKDVLTTLLVGFACTTLIYTSKTFAHNRYINLYKIHLDVIKSERDSDSSKARKEYEAKVFAFDLMRDWHSSDMIRHGTVARRFMIENKDRMTEAMQDTKNEEQRQSVMVILNYFERVGFASQTKMADDSLLRGYFRGVFNFFYNGCEHYIIEGRRARDNHKYFEYLETTVRQWRTHE